MAAITSFSSIRCAETMTSRADRGPVRSQVSDCENAPRGTASTCASKCVRSPKRNLLLVMTSSIGRDADEYVTGEAHA
ncbi:hypothetical protein EVAR_54493_1 [Eumeta japonica]|uniref:Uncharacterized protein n=1 Tax=Eumeta variegata TaxID=151549 RepID=A0A4C1YK14_EUMVA|nr:hypothetical protein EVAR_54493_1 [Eumeta japonica]